MGAKRKDAAKKDEKAEALTNGEEAPAKANGKATKADSAAAATAADTPNGSKNSKAAKPDTKDAVEAVKESAGKVKAKAADAANAAAAQTAAQAKAAASYVKRHPTDVALVLSVCNSIVLLALLGGLGGAGYLARTGQLGSALTVLGTPVGDAGAQGFFALSATDIDGVNVPMSRYAGKLVVAVNVASEDHVRGYTSQNYARLNYLYDKYKPRGLEILAFPCNQFGALEPGSNAQIKAAVRNTYNATFPLFSKVDVKGPNAHPIWRFLLAHQPGNHGYPADIDWNFNKFVVSKLGWPLVRYPLTFDDEDLEGIEGWISANL